MKKALNLTADQREDMEVMKIGGDICE